MHSPLSFTLLKLSVNVSNYLGGTPYIWLKSAKKFTITSTSRRKFYVGYTVVVLYTLWFLTQIPVIVKARIVVRYISIGWYIALLMNHVLQINILLKYQSHLNVLNGTSMYYQYYKCTFMKSRNSTFLNGSEFPFLVLTALLSLFPFLLSLHSFYFPTTPTYVVSVFPKYCHTFPLIVPFCIFTCLILSTMTSSIIYHVYLLMYFVVPFLWIFSKDLSKKKKLHRTKNTTRELYNLRIIYRSIQILSAVWNEGFKEAIPCIQFFLSRLTMLASIVLARHWYHISVFYNILATLTFILSILVWLITLRITGELHERCRKCKSTWAIHNFSRNINPKELKVFRRSCSIVKVKFSSFYAIRKISVLAYLMGTIRGIFKLLVYV